MARPDLSVAESILHNLTKAPVKGSGDSAVNPKAPKAEAAPAPKIKTKNPSHAGAGFKHTRTSPRGK